MTGHWQDRAACIGIDTDLFYPKPGGAHRAKAARALCAVCPVREPCLAYGLAHETPSFREGIWGGMTAPERAAYVKAHQFPSPAKEPAS